MSAAERSCLLCVHLQVVGVVDRRDLDLPCRIFQQITDHLAGAVAAAKYRDFYLFFHIPQTSVYYSHRHRFFQARTLRIRLEKAREAAAGDVANSGGGSAPCKLWFKSSRVFGSKARTGVSLSITACPAGQTLLCLQTTIRNLACHAIVQSTTAETLEPVTFEPRRRITRRRDF